jgi:5-(carboxyamino)imidazole ribonucleotide mutase
VETAVYSSETFDLQGGVAVPKVLIVAGSKSDLKVAKRASRVLDEFGVHHEIQIASAHRNPEKVEKLARMQDVDVFIAIAGLAAHLPGALASRTTRPIIGVPVGTKLGGLDALLSIVQMPPGVPTACVGIDNGKNAALLAIRILALKDAELDKKLEKYSEKLGKN